MGSKNEEVKREEYRPFLVQNINSFSEKFKKFLLETDYSIILVTEHHLDGRSIKAALTFLKQNGWRASYSLATSTGRSEEGTHGGTMILIKSYIAHQPLHEQHGSKGVPPKYPLGVGDDWCSTLVRYKGLDVVKVCMYLDDSIGMTGANIKKWEEVTTFLTSIGLPFIIGGDFNMHPKTVEDSELLRTLKAKIHMDPDIVFTCSQGRGTYDDYIIVSNKLASAVLLGRLDPNSPFSPHAGICSGVNSRPRDIQVKVLKPATAFSGQTRQR